MLDFAGIIINPLPDAYFSLVDKIAERLRAIGIECTHFIITDSVSIPEWCKAIGIETVNDTSLLGLWIHDKDPETCIQVVREVAAKHIEVGTAIHNICDRMVVDPDTAKRFTELEEKIAIAKTEIQMLGTLID